jgi:hypothetical protein
MFQSYWLSLQLIAADIFRLYRNFFHWNLSKIAIVLVTFLSATVLSIPLFGLAWWLVSDMVNGLGGEALQDLVVSGTLPENLVDSLLSNYWFMGALAICALLVLSNYVTCMSYGYYLTTRVYESYIEGERLSVLKNDYFHFPMIWKFLGILGWSSAYLMIPIVYALLGLLVLAALTTGSGILTSNAIIGIIAVVGSVLFFGYFVVMAIRVMFAYMTMLEKDVLEVPARELVRRSMRLASGNIPRIIAMFLPFVIVVAFFGASLQAVKDYRDIRVLESRANAAVLADKNAYVNDHAFIQREFISGYRLTPEQKQGVLAINNAFDARTDGIDPEYLRAIYPYIVLSGTMNENADLAWQAVFGFLSYFLFDGVMIMAYLSMYHILKETGGGKIRCAEVTMIIGENAEDTDEGTVESDMIAKESEKKSVTKPKRKDADIAEIKPEKPGKAVKKTPKKKTPAEKPAAKPKANE